MNAEIHWLTIARIRDLHAEGLTTGTIAARLRLAESTVARHVKPDPYDDRPLQWTVIATAPIVPRGHQRRQWTQPEDAPYDMDEAKRLHALGRLSMAQRRKPEQNLVELVVKKRDVRGRFE